MIEAKKYLIFIIPVYSRNIPNSRLNWAANRQVWCRYWIQLPKLLSFASKQVSSRVKWKSGMKEEEKTVRMLMRGEISQSVNWVLNNGMWLKGSLGTRRRVTFNTFSIFCYIFESVSVHLWMRTPITLLWVTYSADSPSCSHHDGPSFSAQKYPSHFNLLSFYLTI